MTQSPRAPQRSPFVAALLSFLWPGLGHLHLGRRRQAVLFAGPALAVVLVLVVEAVAGLRGLAVYLLTPAGSLTLLILVVLLGVWRVLAVADASLAAARHRPRVPPATKVGIAMLLVLVVGMHAYAAQVAYALYRASSEIFVGGGPDDRSTPNPVGSPAGGGATDDPRDDYVAPPVEPASEESRINILLTGVDSAETRSHALTDTLLVVSIDPVDGSMAMISFPRDIAEFPLWDGRTYAGKINSLMSHARANPAAFPDGPFPTLVTQIGFLLGAPIHYYAAVDMAGLRRLIDEVGGVTVDNPRAINDPAYDWLDGRRGFVLPAGRVTLDGRTALAYVRSRQGAGDNDYTRAARQQQLLLAVRDKVMTPAMLPRIPALVEIAGSLVKTNLPPERLEAMIGVAMDVDTERTRRIVLGPPYSQHPPTSTTAGVWILRLDFERVARLSIELFGDQSRYAAR